MGGGRRAVFGAVGGLGGLGGRFWGGVFGGAFLGGVFFFFFFLGGGAFFFFFFWGGFSRAKKSGGTQMQRGEKEKPIHPLKGHRRKGGVAFFGFGSFGSWKGKASERVFFWRGLRRHIGRPAKEGIPFREKGKPHPKKDAHRGTHPRKGTPSRKRDAKALLLDGWTGTPTRETNLEELSGQLRGLSAGVGEA